MNRVVITVRVAVAMLVRMLLTLVVMMFGSVGVVMIGVVRVAWFGVRTFRVQILDVFLALIGLGDLRRTAASHRSK